MLYSFYSFLKPSTLFNGLAQTTKRPTGSEILTNTTKEFSFPHYADSNFCEQRLKSSEKYSFFFTHISLRNTRGSARALKGFLIANVK